jgi:hypothetical protein
MVIEKGMKRFKTSLFLKEMQITTTPSRAWWSMSIISATQEVEIQRIMDQHRQKVSLILSQKINQPWWCILSS